MTRHPLQRLSSPSRSFSLLVHVLGVLSFGSNFRYLMLWETPLGDAYGWHFQFLTIIGLSLALLSFVLGVLADLTLNSILFKAKNVISIIATPLEVVISILYWGLFLVNKDLLFPEELSLPILPDMGFHLAPAVFLTLDLVLLSPPWTIPGYGVMSLSTVLGFAYWYWVELCHSKNGWYPYPIFEMLNTTQRALLFTFSAGLCTVSSALLKWLYGVVNGNKVAQREAHMPLKKLQ